MAFGNLTGIFNQAEVEPADERSFELMRPGSYDGDIVKADLRESKKGGQFIALEIKLDNGRHVFDNLNIVCANETAQRIAQQALKTIGDTNSRVIEDTEDMIGLRVRARIGIQEASGEYDARNVVKFYNNPNEQGPTPRPAGIARPATASARPAAARPAPTRSSAPASGGNRWMKPKQETAPATGEKANAELDDEIPY